MSSILKHTLTADVPRLNIFDPTGKQVAETSETLAKKDTAPPLFRCGNDVWIESQEDIFPLPKEMNFSQWGDDYGTMFSYTQLPAGKWPNRVSLYH
jgi:hypothetical protein